MVKFNIFALGIFSFNLYVYYLTRGFIASTRAFNFLTRAFNLITRVFSLLARGFELVTRGFEFELVFYFPTSNLFLRFNFTHVSYLVLMFLLLPLNM